MKKTRKTLQVGLGASSILMIFVVLCMMILSVLSFSHAKQSDAIAIREAAYEEAYYKANTKAEKIYEIMKQEKDKHPSMNLLLQLDSIKKVLEEKGIQYALSKNTVKIQITINKQQELNVILEKTNDNILKKEWILTSTGGQTND